MAPRVVLIGPPGAGKSTVGRMVSHRLKSSFADTDEMIMQSEGRSISDIFVDDGEPRFREIESEIVLVALGQSDGVLALGGGSVLNTAVQDQVTALKERGVQIVFLDVSLSGAAPRVGFNRDRPLLLGNPRAQWQTLMNIRRPIYQSLASITIDTSQSPANVIADEIVKVITQKLGQKS